MVTGTVAVLVVSATAVAVIVTGVSEVTVAAENNPEAETLPAETGETA
jgi:hypothetical protein